MVRGLYTSASGMIARSKQQDIIANNISNADSGGYRKDRAVFSSFPEMIISRIESSSDNKEASSKMIGRLGAGSRLEDIAIDLEPGNYRETGNPLDLAVDGESFFTVLRPDGVRMTRNGSFLLDSQGRLVNGSGYPVLGIEGEYEDEIIVDFPEELLSDEAQFIEHLAEEHGLEVSEIYLEGGVIEVDEDGRIFVDGEYVTSILLLDTPNREILRKEAGQLLTFYEGFEDVELIIPERDMNRVSQGMLEGSNVSIVREMVNMVSALRAYEANQRSIQAHDETLRQAVGEVGRLG